MNMDLKKTTALGAAILLAATAASGCSSSPKSGDPTGTDNGVKRGSITATLYDRGNVPPAAGTVDNNRWSKWINEKGPVDVDFIPFPRSEQVQKLNLLFASGDAPDLIMEYDGNF